MDDYTFTARIIARWGGKQPQVQVIPEDQAAFLAWYQRSGLTGNPHWAGDEPVVSISSQAFVALCENVERVRYTVGRRGNQLRGQHLVPLH